MSCFDTENPVVGGFSPYRVALQRSISLAVSLLAAIRILRRGQAIPARAPLAP